MKSYLISDGKYQAMYDEFKWNHHNRTLPGLHDLFELLDKVYLYRDLDAWEQAVALSSAMSSSSIQDVLADTVAMYYIHDLNSTDDDYLADVFMNFCLLYLRKLEVAQLWDVLVDMKVTDAIKSHPLTRKMVSARYDPGFVQKLASSYGVVLRGSVDDLYDKLRGMDRPKTVNDVEPFTQEKVRDIPVPFVFHVMDARGHMWALDLFSLADILESRIPLRNPLTRDYLTLTNIDALKRQIHRVLDCVEPV